MCFQFSGRRINNNEKKNKQNSKKKKIIVYCYNDNNFSMN